MKMRGSTIFWIAAGLAALLYAISSGYEWYMSLDNAGQNQAIAGILFIYVVWEVINGAIYLVEEELWCKYVTIYWYIYQLVLGIKYSVKQINLILDKHIGV